jgi:uncharacterized protein YeaO (DUF488 family)
MIKIKRVYEEFDPEDGVRVLVDRIWPRGLSKQKARVDVWLSDIAPSAELRKWFGHDPVRWSEFKRRYFEELDRNEEAVRKLKELAGGGDVSLLYAAKDPDYNNAVCLSEYLALP